jgi:hypothetical protein
MIEEILYLQNMCLFSIQHHNAHVDTLRSRCYIPRHLNNDIYSCTLDQRYLDRTLSLESIAIIKTMYLEMKIKTVAIQFKITQSVSTPKISKSIHDDHFFLSIIVRFEVVSS